MPPNILPFDAQVMSAVPWANIPGMPGEASADSLVPEDIINQVLDCLYAATY